MVIASAIAGAQIIHVPGDYSTIQEGINASTNGDTVIVANGTWYENIRFMGKAITLASPYITSHDSSDIYNTIIDGSLAINPDSASVVMFINDEDTTSILCGFTITGGNGVMHGALQAQNGGGICGFDINRNTFVKDPISGISNYTWGIVWPLTS